MTRRDRQATETALVNAASDEFAKKGFDAATTRSIAETAGCSEVLIQRYFNGKEGLLLAVLRDKEIDSELGDFMQRPLCADMAEEARQTLTFAMSGLSSRSAQLRIVISRALHNPAFSADYNRISIRGEVMRGLRKRLTQYQTTGIVDASVDIPAACELLLTLNFQLGFVHPELLRTPRAKVLRLVDQFALLFSRAVTSA